jgi:hypothetical protein
LRCRFVLGGIHFGIENWVTDYKSMDVCHDKLRDNGDRRIEVKVNSAA